VNDASSERPQFTLRQLLVLLTVIAVTLAIAAPWMRTMMTHWEGQLVLMTLGWVILSSALMIWLGIPALRSGCTKTAAWTEGFSHGVGMLGILGMLCAVVPAFQRVFKEYDLELPLMTLRLLIGSEAATRYVYLAVPLAMAFVAADVVVFSRLHASPIGRAWAKAWSGVITAVLFTAAISSVVALLAPLYSDRHFHLTG
jgi:hypothetical protein